MRVVVSSEYHMYRGPDGGLYTDVLCVYSYWARMLRVFDQVDLLVRVRDAPLPPNSRRVDGPGVGALAVRDFVGGSGLVAALPSVAAQAWRAANRADAFLLHAPGVMATALHEALRVVGRPFGLEVVGDPAVSLDGRDRLLATLRHVGIVALREQVRRAQVVRFVTRAGLQKSYPPRPGVTQIVASDVELPDELFAHPAVPTRDRDVLELGFIGSLQRPYKGCDVLIDALARTELPHRVEIVGDGQLRAGLEAQARALGIADRVVFRGFLPPGEAIFAFLATRDALVQPSRTEGLPRVLLEAMTVGLPCLSTPVGGVPELLEPAEMFPVDDAAALARAIDALARDRARRRRLAEANRARAWDFRASESDRKLVAFYQAVRDTAGRHRRFLGPRVAGPRS